MQVKIIYHSSFFRLLVRVFLIVKIKDLLMMSKCLMKESLDTPKTILKDEG